MSRGLRELGEIVHVGQSWRETRESLTRAFRAPGRERDLLVQSLKGAVAALLAWGIAYGWLDAPLAFLAPWVALAMVHATVYRSVVKGVQQVVAVVAGVLVAAGGYLVAGNRTVALALVLVLMMPLANWHRFGDQGIYGPLTAVFVITTGDPVGDLLPRLLETVLGVAVGVTVNAFILPPVHLRSAGKAVDGLAEEIAGLLEEVAEGLRRDEAEPRGWLKRADRIRSRFDEARAAVRWSEESARMNPGLTREEKERDHYSALIPLELAAKQTEGVCRALFDALEDDMPTPDRRFLVAYADLLRHTAAMVRAYRCEGALPEAVAAARCRKERLHERWRAEEFGPEGRLVYEALLIETDRLLMGLEQV